MGSEGGICVLASPHGDGLALLGPGERVAALPAERPSWAGPSPSEKNVTADEPGMLQEASQKKRRPSESSEKPIGTLTGITV